MSQIKTFFVSILLSINVLTGCNSNSNNLESSSLNVKQDTLDITVSIVPQKYFVEKIGGDRLSVNVMVKAGAEPATYEPKPQQLKALSEAEGYITIGVPYEKAWMDKIRGSNSRMLIIDSIKGIKKMEMVTHHHDEGENHKNDHNDENFDPHLWLSPQLVKIQAENIYEGLIKLDPENEGEYKQNLEQFIIEIDELDQKIRKNLAGIQNGKFIVFHPAWGYFAREYNLTQIPIEIGGVEPSALELGQLITEAKEENIKVIFAQPEFNTKSAETIAKEINGEVLLITPLAVDWSDNLLQVSQTFAKVMKKENP